MDDNHYKQKLKLILIPAIKAAFCATLAYLIFYVVCINELELAIKEDLANIYLPIGIAIATTGLVLRKFIKRLVYKNGKSGDFYYIIVILWMFGLMFFSAKWIVAVTKPVVTISYINEVSKHPGDLYFKLQNIVPDTTAVQSSYTVGRSGRNNEYTNLYLYFVVPLIPEEGRESVAANSYWICKQYHTSENSHKPEAELTQLFNDFVTGSQMAFKDGDYINSLCFKRLKYSEERVRAMQAIHRMLPAKDDNSVVILEPQDELPAKTAASSLKYIGIILTIGIAIQMLLLRLSLPEIKPEKKRKAATPSGEIKLLLRKYRSSIVTISLVAINVAVFIIMVAAGIDIMSPFAPDLLKFGAANQYNVTHGGAWRLMSSIFMHAGLVHLINNMAGLFIIGIIMEPQLGKVRFLTLYLLSGIVAAVCGIWFNPLGANVGASGAIFGLYGAGLVFSLLTKNRSILTLILIFAGFTLFMGALTPGVSNSAHTGGLVTGALLYFLIIKLFPVKPNETPGKR